MQFTQSIIYIYIIIINFIGNSKINVLFSAPEKLCKGSKGNRIEDQIFLGNYRYQALGSHFAVVLYGQTRIQNIKYDVFRRGTVHRKKKNEPNLT